MSGRRLRRRLAMIEDRAPRIPEWDVLRGMSAEEVRALAEAVGVAYTGRASTLSVLNERRQ